MASGAAGRTRVGAMVVATPGLLARAVLRTGSPASTIAEMARQEGADLIVVGSHGRAGLDRLILGSVAERVVRLASGPVLVVKSAEAAARADAA